MPTLSSLNCTAGHFTSWKNENVSEMYKNEKGTCKACKLLFFIFNTKICQVPVAVVVVVAKAFKSGASFFNE